MPGTIIILGRDLRSGGPKWISEGGRVTRNLKGRLDWLFGGNQRSQGTRYVHSEHLTDVGNLIGSDSATVRQDGTKLCPRSD